MMIRIKVQTIEIWFKRSFNKKLKIHKKFSFPESSFESEINAQFDQAKVNYTNIKGPYHKGEQDQRKNALRESKSPL